jgi:predicted membrane-bound spermidine synthase
MARLLVYLCAALLGAALMGFEMVASRYLTPYFGSGILTWAALISMVLLSMTAGYFIGGYLVDRYPTFRLAALFAGIAGVWLLVIPSVAGHLLEAIMINIEDEVTGVLIGSFVLLLVPITALGTFSPIALRLVIRRVAATGRTAGTIYGISTFGSIVGTIGTAVYLVPRFGSSAITLMLGAVVLACAAILLTLPHREEPE